MLRTLHITNGDSAANGMKSGGIEGEIISWRDLLHEGPVPGNQTFKELSQTRANWLAEQGFGDAEELRKSFEERDEFLFRYTDFDEVVLWFEWDLYDQLQLIQILDFLSQDSEGDRAETNTRLTIVSFNGYLGNLDPERFAELYERRKDITHEMLLTAQRAWSAFRSSDPRDLEKVAREGTDALEFLELSLWRHLEELPSTTNGLSRSESQVLEAVSQGPLTFHELFKQVSNREERIFCGDTMMARYIERLSLTDKPLITYTSGDRIDAPSTEEDSRAFRNAEMCLTVHGRSVLACEADWIHSGGSDRWLGGHHLEGARAQFRWNADARTIDGSKGLPA
jgi:hypothetical protein